MSETITGAQSLVYALEAAGVTDVFGIPGGAILPTYDAIFVHNADGEPRAYVNCCPHRLSQLTHAERGRQCRLKCQYHGWEFDGKSGFCVLGGEDRLQVLPNRLLDGYLAGVPADKLAKANHKLAGNFDGPIQDLEF